MSRIILQPTGNDTKESFIENRYPSWAEKDKEIKKVVYREIWEDSVGNTVLFIKNNAIFAIAIIEAIEEDYDTTPGYPLRYIWNDNIQFTDISLEKLNNILGYALNYVPRNYSLVKEENTDAVFNLLNNYVSKIYYENEDRIYQNDIQSLETEFQDFNDEADVKSNLSETNKTVYPRKVKNAKKALELAEYKCELNKNHITFKTKASNRNYVEAHHLIPLQFHENFNYSLDVPANIISLCPTCHSMLHLGDKVDITKSLEILYNSRKKRLDIVKLNINLSELEYIYETK